MQHSIVLDEKTVDTLLHLAAEDEVTPEALVAELVNREDERRHVERLPYEGSVRMRCFSGHCGEKTPRHNLFELEEL